MRSFVHDYGTKPPNVGLSDLHKCPLSVVLIRPNSDAANRELVGGNAASFEFAVRRYANSLLNISTWMSCKRAGTKLGGVLYPVCGESNAIGNTEAFLRAKPSPRGVRRPAVKHLSALCAILLHALNYMSNGNDCPLYLQRVSA